MRTTCINHPPQARFIRIYLWAVEACDGNHCAAALLSFFEYWHNIRLEQSVKSAEANKTAEKHGEDGSQDTSLIQFHTAAQLATGLGKLYSKDSIQAGIKILKSLGFIEVMKNPNPRYAFDATNHFLFHPEAVNRYLADRYTESSQTPTENRQRATENPPRAEENRQRATENGRTIHENTRIDYLQSNTSVDPDYNSHGQNNLLAANIVSPNGEPASGPSPLDFNSGSHKIHQKDLAGIFDFQYQIFYSLPAYLEKKDFVQAANLINRLQGKLTEPDFQTACLNYLSTPQGNHTLADLCKRYAVFRLYALDKYGKPVEKPAQGQDSPGKAISGNNGYNKNTTGVGRSMPIKYPLA